MRTAHRTRVLTTVAGTRPTGRSIGHCCPGVWLHNLEHGAVVVLYNCPSACPDLVAGLTRVYASLPLDPNARTASPRLLIVPYTDMDHRIAVAAWNQLIEFDELDAAAITDFYVTVVNRGPECINLRCPD